MELLEPDCATKSMEFATIQSLKEGLGHNGGVQGRKASKGVDREHRSSTVQPICHAQFQTRSNSSIALKGRGKTLHLPLFCSVDSRAFVSWLYEVECYFESNHFSEEKKSKLVISCLRGDALTWVRNATCANKDGMFKCKYWHKLKSNLKEMYLNKAVMNDLENEFKNLKMDSLCVKDYAMMFNELYFICGNPNDNSKKINLFYKGLNSEIQTWINIEQICSFELLCELALNSEYLIYEHEVHMESLARENAKQAVVVSSSKRLGSKVPLIYGLISSDKGAVLMSVLGNIIVQGSFQDLKLDHEAVFKDLRWSELHLGSQNTKDHAYVDENDPLLILKCTIGDDLQLAYAQLSELNSEFPWECWSIERGIGLRVESKSSKERLGFRHLWLPMGNTIEHSGHSASNADFGNVNLGQRFVVMVFEPGDTQPRIEAQVYAVIRTKRGQQASQTQICCNISIKFCVLTIVLQPRPFIVIFDPGGKNGSASVKMGFNCFQ